MKKIIILLSIFVSMESIKAQHVVRLDNTTTEDILVRLYFQEDDPACGGSTTSTNYFVPAFSAIFLSTPVATPGGSDYVLFGAKVLESGSPVMPVSVSAHGSTTNATWNLNACPLGITPPLPILYQSAFSSIWYTSTTWTSAPIVPASTTSTGNLMHLDEITFF
jgi:hypothetical protein